MQAAAPSLPAAPAPAAPPAPPSLSELEDQLYDLLATGVADASLPSGVLDAAQAFLHQHARERKSQADFMTFFEQHGLALRPERPNLLALPVLEVRGRAAETPALETLQAAEPPMEVELAAAISRKRVSPWVWAIGFAAISGMTACLVMMLLESRAEFTRVHAEAAQLAANVEQLRLETQSLRAELKATAQRTEHDTQLLLRAFASPLDLNSR